MFRSTLILTIALFFTATSFADESSNEPSQVETIAQLDDTPSAISPEADQDAISLQADDFSEDQEAQPSLIHPFGLSASWGNTFPIGSLVRDQYTVTNYYQMRFGLSASYSSPIEGLGASLSGGYSKFLTEAGGDTFQREGRFGDLSLGLNYGNFFHDKWLTGIAFSAGIGFSIPISDYSRFTNLYTSISPSLSLSRSFGNLSLSYSFSFSKNLHEHTSVVADLNNYDIQILARDGGLERIGEGRIALETGVLSSFSLSNSLSLSYRWFEGFSTALSWGFSDYFTYDNGTITAQDRYTSPYAVVGRGHGQSMSGSLSASYSFLDMFSANLAMSTNQQPLTADQQNVRFPFFDLETGNLQATSISFGLSARY